MRIEMAMAERRIPPLHPFQFDKNENKNTSTSIRKILIVSTWRTGSSFLGEIIQSHPGVFYSYEPLHFNPPDSIKLIDNLFQCKFTRDYLLHINGMTDRGQDFMRRNRRIWQPCHRFSLCHLPAFVDKLCSFFPIHLMKIVRLRVGELAKFLISEPATSDWKIIYLMRDPRGVMASRKHLNWCQQDAECGNVENLCSAMLDDMEWIEKLKTKNPDRHYLLKFEDLTENVDQQTRKLFDFLNLNVTVPVKVFLSTHTRSSGNRAVNLNRTELVMDRDPFSTNRQSKSIAFEWKSKLSSEEIASITKICQPILNILGYTQDGE